MKTSKTRRSSSTCILYVGVGEEDQAALDDQKASPRQHQKGKPGLGSHQLTAVLRPRLLVPLGLGALHGEERKAWRAPLLDAPRKWAGVWEKGMRLVIDEPSHWEILPTAGQGKRHGRFSLGWEPLEGQDPKPRNSRDNTSQFRDPGGGPGRTTSTFQGRLVGEGAQPRGGRMAPERPLGDLGGGRWHGEKQRSFHGALDMSEMLAGWR